MSPRTPPPPATYDCVMDPALRIIDANANRAREALRVMEEAARFHLEDRELTQALKDVRHDFTREMQHLENLEFHRDTPGDVGTEIETDGERRRESIAEVVIAAGKRLSEALRAIEEYGKTIDPDFAASIERLRYRGYEIEQRINRALGSGRAQQWRLCVILSSHLIQGRSITSVAEDVIRAGADCIQLREKGIDDSLFLSHAAALRKVTRGRAALIINDRPDIAIVAGADGVHLGQHDLPCTRVRELFGNRLMVGVSTSNLDEAKQALRDGADYCGVGPMFPTTTKKKQVIAGTDYLRKYLDWDRLPHLAIGGVSESNLGELVETGCRGVAVCSAVCSADDPGAVVKRMFDTLTRHPQRVSG